MKFGSLFSGIGGLDLGLERAGMTCVWQSEIDPYASRVLAKHWPNIPNLGDINGINWNRVPAIDVICGGYPCQPFSYAGHRNGTDDPRHLWPRFFDAVRILRPRFALLENVPGHLSLGFGQVLADLASIGYNTQWDCIPAAAVGAPHLRDRVFVIATPQTVGMDTNSDSDPDGTFNAIAEPWPSPMANTDSAFSERGWASIGRSAEHSNVDVAGALADSDVRKDGRRLCSSEQHQRKTSGRRDYGRRNASDAGWEWWQTEPDVGRVADGVSNRVDRLRGLGNAVVPQVAEHVGNIIMGMAND